MARWPSENDENTDSDWDLSEGLDPDGPSALDLDRFGDELSNCPECQKTIYDQIALCPHCGHAPGETSPSVSLWVVGVVLVVIVLLLVVVL